MLAVFELLPPRGSGRHLSATLSIITPGCVRVFVRSSIDSTIYGSVTGILVLKKMVLGPGARTKISVTVRPCVRVKNG